MKLNTKKFKNTSKNELLTSINIKSLKSRKSRKSMKSMKPMKSRKLRSFSPLLNKQLKILNNDSIFGTFFLS